MTAASFKNEMVGIKDRNVKIALQQIKETKCPDEVSGHFFTKETIHLAENMFPLWMCSIMLF